ncbi:MULTISPECIES: hypothetical protein [unclassified Streptomyces]|uniref:hypothetical protein n=1 Tax=unclassified Streptomyces TaxID=2593676 RepID=UPI00093CD92E|nr:hypothetical protein [Streptomyces sp. CB02400]OKK09379.1 hypothetical protein AMK33_15950 [Streptomyces sp. CB02400]
MVLGSGIGRGNTRTGRRGPRTAGRGTALAAALFLVLAPGLAACGDDGGGGGSGTSTPSPDRTTSAPGSAPANQAEAEQEIRQNWEKFFDPQTPVEEKKKLLQNGELLGPVLEAFSGDNRVGQVKAEVTEIAFISPTEADVTFTLTLRGATALPDASGVAVDDDGTWKVSVKSLCALVQLSGDESPPDIPGC